MGTYFFRTENVQIGTGLLTITHGLGVAPAGANGMVLITSRSTATNSMISVVSSNSQIVVVQAGAANMVADITVMAIHSIIS